MEIKRILSTTVLTVALMATACAPKASGPVDKDDGHHTIVVNNLEDMEKDWMAGGSTRTIDLSIKEDGVEKKAIEEQVKGNLTFEIGDTSIATNSGFIFTALKVGKTTVAVKYGDSVKVVNLNIVEKPAEPAVVTGKTVAQILEDVKTTGQTRIYELNGKVKNFGTKAEWTQYGELNVIDDSTNDPVYIYGSYVNTEAEPAYFEWNGEQYTSAKYTARNVLTNDMTKDLKKGDIVKLNVMYSTQYNNFYGIWVSVTAGQVVPATSVTLNKTEVTLEAGSSETLTATILPEDCNQKAVWTTSDAEIAKVSGGKITAVAPGTATITCTVGEQTATCAVTVERAAANVVKLTPETLMGYTGTAMSYGDGEHEYSSVTYQWIELGSFGDGIQMRNKNGKQSTVWNKTAYSKVIEELILKPNTNKMKNNGENCLKISFAKTADFADAEEHTVSYTAGQNITVTPTMKDAVFFKIAQNSTYTYSQYYAEFDVCVAE